MKIISGVYKIINIINNKYYFGSSNNIQSRLYEHKRLLNRNKHFNIKLQNSWNKYGESCFEFVVIEECDNDRLSLLSCEQIYLDIGAQDKENCYNLSFTAGRVDWTPELKKIISDTHIGNSYRKNSVWKNINEALISHLKDIWITYGKGAVAKEAKLYGVGGRVCDKLIKEFRKDEMATLLRAENYIKDLKQRGSNLKPNYDPTIYTLYNIYKHETYIGTKRDFFKKYKYNIHSRLFKKSGIKWRGWKMVNNL